MKPQKISKEYAFNLWVENFKETIVSYFGVLEEDVTFFLRPFDSDEEMFNTMAYSTELKYLHKGESASIPYEDFKKSFFDLFRDKFIEKHGVNTLIKIVNMNFSNPLLYNDHNANSLIENNIHRSLMELPSVVKHQYLINMFVIAINKDKKANHLYDTVKIMDSFKKDNHLFPMLKEVLVNSKLGDTPDKRLKFARRLPDVPNFLDDDLKRISNDKIFNVVESFIVQTSKIKIVSLNNIPEVVSNFNNMFSEIFKSLKETAPDKYFKCDIENDGEINLFVDKSFCTETIFLNTLVSLFKDVVPQDIRNKKVGEKFMNILNILNLETTLKEKLEDMAQDTSEKTNFSNPTFKL